jgi:hypothetical protein
MSTFVAGQRIQAESPDKSTSVVGELVPNGVADSLDIAVMGQNFLFIDSTGELRPRWAAAVVTILSEPRPDMPERPYALVEASHADVNRSMWIRLPAGNWRAVGARVFADWFELQSPVVHFGGVAQ